MIRTLAAVAAATLVTIGGPSPAAAQALAYGTWTGTMTPPPNPNGQSSRPVPVTYEVGELDGTLAVVMRALLVQEIIPFHDVRVEGDRLTFWWEPGVRVDCTLSRTAAGGFEGPCTAAGGGGSGVLSMVPPGGPTP